MFINLGPLLHNGKTYMMESKHFWRVLRFRDTPGSKPCLTRPFRSQQNFGSKPVGHGCIWPKRRQSSHTRSVCPVILTYLYLSDHEQCLQAFQGNRRGTSVPLGSGNAVGLDELSSRAVEFPSTCMIQCLPNTNSSRGSVIQISRMGLWVHLIN